VKVVLRTRYKRLQINNFMFSLQTPSNGSFQPKHLCLKLCKQRARNECCDWWSM